MRPVAPLGSLISALSLFAFAQAAQAISVTSTSPSRYALGVSDALTQITVTFDAPPVVPNAAMVRVAGTMSGLHQGTVSVVGNVVTFTNADPWMVGELVHVNLRSDIAAGGGGTLANGYVFAFTIRSGPAAATWSAPLIYDSGDVPYFIYGGDIDGDGTADVASPCENSSAVATHLNKEGTGYFPEFELEPCGDVASSVFGEDFDNDGDVDLATADIADGTISVLLNNGDGTFAPRTPYSAGNVNTRQIHGGDFDGDNDVDLCATSYGTGQVYLFRNDGLGAFTSTVYSNVQSGPFAIRTGDFNGDGRLDIGVACQSADSVSVMMNQGAGTFATTGKFRIGDGPWCLNGNDFDGDGDFDLASVASFGNRIHFLYNDGTGAFPTRSAIITEAFPLGVYVADLDGDGDVDAMSSNYSGASVQPCLNNGTGTFTLQTTLDTQASGSYTWAHDLDGDGDLDLSVVDENADKLFIFYNGPAPALASPEIATGAAHGAVRLVVAPNPMRAGVGTSIAFRGSAVGETLLGPRTVEILDVLGRRLRTLGANTDATSDASGTLTWDGRDEAGRAVASGVYFISARAFGSRFNESVRVLR